MPTITSNLFWGTGEGEFRLEVTEGKWPTDADGRVFIVGPDKREPGGHWFNEHGLLCRIDCEPDAQGRVPVKLKLIDTPIQKLRARFPALFKKLWVLEASPFGFSNLANTNVQPIDDRLFVGYDVGRPLEVDPETLAFITPVGRNDEWESSLPGLLEPMISVAAHPAPAFDENALYFVNYVMGAPGAAPDCWVARWDLEGPVERWKLSGISPFDSIHDIKATKNHLVISDLPFVVEPQTFQGKPRTKPSQDFTRLWVIRKADLRRVRPGADVPFKEITLPMATGHLALDYDDSDGTITAYLQHIPAADLTIAWNEKERSHATGRPVPREYEGLIDFGLQPSVVGRYKIDASSGEVHESKLAYDAEHFWNGVLWHHNSGPAESRDRPQNLFYASIGWDPELVPETGWKLYKDYPHTVVPMDQLPEHYIPGALARIDLEAMSFADRFSYSGGAFPSPPTFVPRKNCKHDLDGYVVVPVHKDGPKEIHIFDAANLAQGPIAKASAPGFNPPLLLHSCWMAERRGARPSHYKVSPVRDTWGALRKFPDGANRLRNFLSGAMPRKKRGKRAA